MQSTVLLPSPEQGNAKNLASTVQTMRSIDGTLYTYIKAKRGRKVYQWEFITRKEKGDELKGFISRFTGDFVKVTDHNDVQVIGYMTINPFELDGQGGRPEPSGTYSFTLQLEQRV